MRKLNYQNQFILSCLLISLTLFLSNCGGSKGGRSHTGQAPSDDTTPPTVSSTVPANGATRVPLNVILSATFSEPINPDTLTANSFIVLAVGVSGGTRVSGTVAYTAETMTASFTPDTILAIDTLYAVTITTAVEDEAGNAMAESPPWSFTSGAAIDNTPPSFPGGDPQLVAQATSSNSISLSWTAATDNTTLENQIRYVICQSTVSTDCTVDPFLATGGNVTITETAAGQKTLEVNGLSSNTTYYFVVRAKDQVNLMDSNIAQKSVTTPGSFKSLSTSLNNLPNNPAAEPSIATVGTTVYVAWQEGNTPSDIFIKSFDTALPENSSPTTPPSQRVWSNVAVSEINSSGNHQKQPRLVSDRSNPPIPYITYTECDSTGENCKVYVRKREGTAWTLVGSKELNISSANSAESSAIAFDQNNTPYVVWVEKDTAQTSQIWVSHLEGSTWISDPNPALSLNQDSGKKSFSPAIAISGTTIRVAWVECVATNTSKCQLYVKGWTGTAWTLIGTSYLNVGDPNFIQAYPPSLAFINGVLHISWHEGEKVYVRKEQGGSFSAVGTLTHSVSSASNTPLSGTATGSQTLYLALAEKSGISLTTGPYLKVLKWNSTDSTWVTEGITGDNPTGALNMTGGDGSSINSSFTFVEGTPYVAWTETGSCGSECGQINFNIPQLYMKRLQ